MVLQYILKNKTVIILSFLYLTSIVLANLTITKFGAPAVLFNALVLISLDLTARDKLHSLWHKNLKRNMLLLVTAGSILTIILNRNSIDIAVKSFISFILAFTVDFVVYARLINKSQLYRSNVSNIFSSFVDSASFIFLVFGWQAYILVIIQTVMKIIGGFIWSLVLMRKQKNGELSSKV